MKKLLLLGVVCALGAALPLQSPWRAVLVEDGEPGVPLIVSGVVYEPDGQTPVVGARVHVYHTDAEGRYAPPGTPQGTKRLQGDMWTNERGQYWYRTIRPAGYPGDGCTPAHIHYTVTGKGLDTNWFDLEFEDDPCIPAEKVATVRPQGRFAPIRPAVPDDDGVFHATYDLRVER